MEEWRGKLFSSKYLPLVRPFSAVPELLRRVREAGLRVAVASSAKKSELSVYFDIAGIQDLIDIAVSSEDAEHSKPSPDIFQVALRKLGTAGSDAVAIGDTPYDAEAAGGAGIPTIGMLCGGFAEAALRNAGCIVVYPGPGALLACFGASRWPPKYHPKLMHAGGFAGEEAANTGAHQQRGCRYALEYSFCSHGARKIRPLRFPRGGIGDCRPTWAVLSNVASVSDRLKSPTGSFYIASRPATCCWVRSGCARC